jgi:hypothetical protein
MVPAAARLGEVPGVILEAFHEKGGFLRVRAPRLSGKTTWLRGLAATLGSTSAWASVVLVSCRGRTQRALIEGIFRATARGPAVVLLDDVDSVAHAGLADVVGEREKTLVLPDFTLSDVAALCAEHTAETGQPFTHEAMMHIERLSGGRPWAVNMLAREVVEGLGIPLRRPIEREHVDEARRRIVGALV